MFPNEGIAVTDLTDRAPAVSAGAYWRVHLLKIFHGFPSWAHCFRPFPHGHVSVGLNFFAQASPFLVIGLQKRLDLPNWHPGIGDVGSWRPGVGGDAVPNPILPRSTA